MTCKKEWIFPRVTSITVFLFLALVLNITTARADTTFNVSANVNDNSSTILTGTFVMNTTTGVIDGFNFVVPTLVRGTTTIPGLTFTPETATGGFFNPAGVGGCAASLGSVFSFNINGVPGGTETLQFLVPQTTPVGYSGGTILPQIPCSDRTFFSVFGNEGNFVTISGGEITASTVPESSSLLMLIAGMFLLVVKFMFGRVRDSVSFT